jgi:MFS family permease
VGPRYKWTALTNTSLGMFMALLDATVLMIALPAIFRGIHVDPLHPANADLLLWSLLSYGLVTAVLVVTVGRLGDIFGRVRMYNLGFVIFTVASVFLALLPSVGRAGAIELIIARMVQGTGGAFLMANSAAILTDAFPPGERGMAMGLNMVSGLAGSFVGLVLGGVLASVNWHLVFWINVPIGAVGTLWAFFKLKETGVRTPARIDWWGNVTFAGGLVMILVAITYSLQPYGGHSMAWTRPLVMGLLAGGAALLAIFLWVETRVAQPLMDLRLFRIRAFTGGNIAGFLSFLSRGGLQFMLIIWLQGIWLPLHGYSFERTPLWAGLYMIPLTAGILVVAPISGWLSDHYGARPFATGGMIGSALSFGLLMFLPVNFSFAYFGPLLFVSGLTAGLFMSPNTAGIMNSLPARERGAGSGIRSTFTNTGNVLSMGVFFTLMIVGISGKLPAALFSGLVAQGVPAQSATQISHLPAVSSLFAALLGSNPLGTVIPHQVLAALPAATAARITGTTFFPQVISAAFQEGLRIVFGVGVVLCLAAAGASWMRGAKYLHAEEGEPLEAAPEPVSATVLSGDRVGDSGSDSPAVVRVTSRLAGEEPDGG